MKKDKSAKKKKQKSQLGLKRGQSTNFDSFEPSSEINKIKCKSKKTSGRLIRKKIYMKKKNLTNYDSLP